MPHQCTNCGRTFQDGSKEMLSGCPDCGGNKFQFAPASSTDRDSSATSGGDRDGQSSSTTGVTGGTVSRAANTVRDWVSDSDSGSESKANAKPDSTPTPNPDSDPNPNSTPNPGSDSSAPGRTDDSESFPEWPDTARPPADRSTAQPTDSGSSDWPEDPNREQRESPTRSRTADDNGPSGGRDGDSRDGDNGIRDDGVLGEDERGTEDSAQANARSGVVSPDELPPPADQSGSELPPVDSPRPDDAVEERPDHGRVVSEPSGDRPSLEQLREELNDQFESIKILRPGQYELNLMELYDRDEYIVSLQEDGRYVIDVPESWHDDGDD